MRAGGWRGKGVVVPISVAIVTVSSVSTDALLSGTGAGIGGGLGAHGAARATGSAGLFQPTVMERLATGSYPAADPSTYPASRTSNLRTVSNPELVAFGAGGFPQGYGTRIPRPRTRPPSRSRSASLTAASG